MQPRTLDQIISELNPSFDPQVRSIEQRAQLIPGQIQSEEQALGARQEEAFGNILSGARRRGIGFSGIPLGEQARYTATEYLPSLARLRTAGQERASSLQDAILSIRERQNTLAQQLYGQDLDRAAQERQAELSRRAAAAAAISPSFNIPNAPTTSSAQSQPAANYGFVNSRDASGGYWFSDAQGNRISPVKYAQLMNIPEIDLIRRMAESGDAGARNLLRGSGIDISNPNYRPYFAWDVGIGGPVGTALRQGAAGLGAATNAALGIR